MRNPGKLFEDDVKKSVPDDCYFCRIPDPAQSFSGVSSLRFVVSNPYDCFLYRYPNLLCLELKSTQSTAITFWREDFVTNEAYKDAFMIKRHQIEGLRAAAKCAGVYAGFLLNFRKNNHTYYLPIQSFDVLSTATTKRSINESDVMSVPHLVVDQTLKRVHYSYDMEKLLNELGDLKYE